MSKSNNVKYLSIDIQYKDREELKSMLETIGNLVVSGVDQYKQKYNDSCLEFSTSHLISSDIDYRIESQNGKTVLILPSKMNKK